MEFVLAVLQWQMCLVYLDDVIVFGRDFEEHLVRLRESFRVIPPGRAEAETLKVPPVATESPFSWPLDLSRWCEYSSRQDKSSGAVAGAGFSQEEDGSERATKD